MSQPTRRSLLQWGAAGTGLWLAGGGLALAQAAGERRFVFVIQRGAADGLHTVVPYADPGYARLRGALAVDPETALKLDGTFALHPSLAETGKLYAAGQALFVHAVASPYRDRSHFDGQNILESGGGAPYQLKDGWLNRLAGQLAAPRRKALALAVSVPMALRGAAPATSYAPSQLPPPGEDLLMRVQQLYDRDPQLHALWSAALEARSMAAGGMEGESRPRMDGAGLGKLAASFLAQPRGPRIAMMETSGWDTHSGQAGRMNAQLRNLDNLVAALRDGLGAAWNHTVVLVATEFGRTAAANGTGGTDHGTASAALLVGGAVRGGRVIADWPGLATADLYEARDLRPTLGLDALIAGAAGECFGLDAERFASGLYPGRRVKPLTGLVSA